MSGSHINAKVAYLCNGVYKKAWLKPHREMALLDRVANQKRPGEESPCVTEITVLMACWKTNNFEDLKCSDEIAAFRKCIATAKYNLMSVPKSESSAKHRPKRINNFWYAVPPSNNFTPSSISYQEASSLSPN